MNTCSIKNCGQPAKTRGWCKAHYSKWLKTGDPTTPNKRRGRGPEALKKILNTKKFPVKKCVVDWPAGTKQRGYPTVEWENKRQQVSRIVCRHFHGIPKDRHAVCRHLCNNPTCYNPNHLRWGRQKDNVHDKKEHGTWGMKLTAVQVAGIYADPRSYKEIAETYDISTGMARLIKNRRVWKHVSDWLESH